MIDWAGLQQEYDAIIRELAAAALEPSRRKKLQKRSFQLGELLEKHREVVSLERSVQELQDLAQEESELSELYVEELAIEQQKLHNARTELDGLLYPSDEMDQRSVFLEIRAGAGGQEAALFAADLFKMYSNYALSKRWQVSIVDEHQTDIGGYKELIAFIKGKDVYKYLKFESGVHRVQRVPATETQGRIHTSTVTVVVLPEAEEVEMSINPSDLRIDVFRSSGPGGQSVNTTDSAVRITHVPTGIVVSCQDERSQIKNKAKAMKILQARLLDAEKQRQEEEISVERRKQVGAGARSEKIRTYNFPQNRVTDHRVNVTLKKLDIIMQGELDDLFEPLIAWDLEQRRAKGVIVPGA